MLARVTIALVVLSGTGCPPGDSSALTEGHRFYIDREHFTAVTKVSALPDAIVADLARAGLLHHRPRWASGPADTLGRPRTPDPRVIAAACSSHHCLVQIEGGTFLPRHEVRLYGLTDGRAELEWRGHTRVVYRDPNALRSWIAR